ncbi:beta-galactosidase-like isoform X2 [Tubulanus polymorphus]|uniref:beta-galactosidase-like isoform X2 n=1 Tax=Tubulanus polymorphus TaxID=672921 RepID=UPI003DA213B1
MADARNENILTSSLKVLLILVVTAYQVSAASNERSFTIDYEKETFVKDGVPFRYVSGSLHYARVPSYYWRDRLTKMFAAGLDAVQTYVPWNFHETFPGEYNFQGDHDLIQFVRTAQDVGLLVILRAGPYICGEWEFGGFPGWLLKHNSSMVLRTMDPGYLAPVGRWLSVLLPKIRPHLYSNGGPIIMVQPENEYGSWYACDHRYMQYLYDTFSLYLKNEVVLMTTDGCIDLDLKCGGVKGKMYATIDFGPTHSTKNCFDIQMNFNRGPKVNSEFYTGWLDLWGKAHSHTDSSVIANYLDQMLKYANNTNVNMYMFEGGTNFGYWNGAEMRPYVPQVTSYDYDSPLSEAGDLTTKYFAVQKTISKYKRLPSVPMPKNTTKYAYGKVQLRLKSTVLNMLSTLSPKPPVLSKYPLTMEQIDHYYGFVVYRHILKKSYTKATLNISGIRDRGYVLVNSVSAGMVVREHNRVITGITVKTNDILDIIVENQGRIGFAIEMLGEIKGIISNVTMNKDVLTDWKIYPLTIENAAHDKNLRFEPKRFDETVRNTVKTSILLTPALFEGTIPAARDGKNYDTFLKMGPSWIKGQVFINGFNVGRYWPAKGPQVTLYVPAHILKPAPAKNSVLILELESAPCSSFRPQPECSLEFIDYPILSKPKGTAAGRPRPHHRYQLPVTRRRSAESSEPWRLLQKSVPRNKL